MPPEQPFMRSPKPSDPRLQLIDRVNVLVERARRKNIALSVGVETDRLASEYPNCPMSKAELRDTIVRIAAASRVRVHLV